MSFLENICACLGIDKELSPCRFRYSIYGSKGGFFEGVLKIKTFSSTNIVFEIKNGEIIVKGKNLQVKKFYEQEIAINGIINEVTVK